MKISYYFLPIILIICIAHGCTNDVSLFDENWTYTKGNCHVSFSLKNNQNEESSQKIRITAFKESQVGKGGIVSNIIAKKEFTVTLRPNEIREIEQDLLLKIRTRPTLIVFKNKSIE